MDMHTQAFEDFKALMASGEFHHATYRDFGKCWEGLHIYRRDESGFRGFSHATIIGKNSPYLKEAERMVSHTGYSVGSYGNG